jgi:hypothetical protein
MWTAVAIVLVVVAAMAGGRALCTVLYGVPLGSAIPLVGASETKDTGGLVAVAVGCFVFGLLAMGIIGTISAKGQGAPTGRDLHMVFEVSPLAPAHKKLIPGDVIRTVNGTHVYADKPLIDRINAIGLHPITFTFKRKGVLKSVTLTPMKEADGNHRIGINLKSTPEVVVPSFFGALGTGFWYPIRSIGTESAGMIGAVFGQSAFELPISERLGRAKTVDKIGAGLRMGVWLWLLLLVVAVGALVARRFS